MIKNLRNRSDFVKNSLKLVAGTAIAQAISILASPIISRLFTPADFGTFTFIISIIGGFGLIATLRYEMAILLPKEEKNAVNVVFLSLKIAFLIGIAITCAILIYNFWAMKSLLLDKIDGKWLYSIPVMVLLLATGNVFQHWFNRKKEYRVLAFSKIINAAGNNLVTVWLGFIGFGVWGLLIGNFMGLLFFNLLFVMVIMRKYRGQYIHYDGSSHKALAKQYRNLPLANTPQMLVELIQLYGIIFLLQGFYSSEVVGWYSLSQRLLQAPMWLIGTSLSQVYYKEASEQFTRNGDISKILAKTIKMSTIVALPVLLLMLTVSPWLIAFIFGEPWRESGEIARILAPWFFFDFVRYSIAQTPLIIGKTTQMFFISLTGAALMIVALTMGAVLFSNVLAGFIVLSAVLSFYSITVIWWTVNAVKKVIPNENS